MCIRDRVQFGGFTDPESGVSQYALTIMDYNSSRVLWGPSIRATGSRSHNEQSVVEIQVSLAHGGRYLVVVEAQNAAGLKSNATNAIIVDSSTPIAGVVRHGIGATATKCQSYKSPIQVTWQGFRGGVSGIHKYQCQV